MLAENRIYNCDAREALNMMDDESIDMVMTSPPYDDLRKYKGSATAWNYETFKSIARDLYRVLKPGGVIVWVVNDKTDKGSETGSAFKEALYFMELGLNINDTMIWEKTNPMPQVKQPRYNQVFEYMFVFSKGKPKTFNPLMEPCKCAGQTYDSTCKNMGGENGRTHKTFNINPEKVMGNIWKIAVAQNQTTHPAVYPYEIPYRHIQTWTNEGELVLDPFIGSGTTALAAIDLDRKFIGIELNEEYCKECTERVNEYIKLKSNDSPWR